MLLLLLAKRMLRPVYAARRHHHPLISGRRSYSSASGAIESSAAAAADPKPPNFLTDHLTTSWGFSPKTAAIISKSLSKPKNPDKPVAVLRFLTNHGFDKSDIYSFSTLYPTFIPSTRENTLDIINIPDLHDIGLSTSLLIRILLSSPDTRHLHSASPRTDFHKSAMEAALLGVVTPTRVVDLFVIKNVAPKVAFLESQGFSLQEIRRIAFTVPWFLTSKIGFIEKLLDLARELGSPTLSRGMFMVMLRVAIEARKKLQEKKELFRNFGWSEDEFLDAMERSPTMVENTKENLEAKLNFLVGELGWFPSTIADRSHLLTLSLEKRIKPRHRVVRLLESKGKLSGKNKGFYAALLLSHVRFVERYILPHEEEIPELREAYLAAS